MIYIYFHQDTDGMYSAVILADFLCRKRKHKILFRPINYDAVEKGWETEILPKNSFVVDFKYTPTSLGWFDHHETGKGPFAQTSESTRVVVFDPSRKSCAGMIYDYLKALQSSDWNPNPWIDIVRWADIVDSASYESAEQVVLSKEPALKIRQVLMDKEIDIVETLKKILKYHGDLERVAEDYKDTWQKRHKKIEKILRYYPKIMTIHNSVAYLDLIRPSTKFIGKDKYAPFFIRPDLDYCVSITGWQNDYQCGAGKNPWKKVKDLINLAELAQKYGGGGHHDVMGINKGSAVEVRNIGMKVFRALAYRKRET